MGYNKSKNSVRRNLPQLEQLAASEGSLRFPTANPKSLAFKLREALAAAKVHPEYRHLHEAVWPRFEFREVPGAVIATRVYPDTKLGEPLDGSVSKPTSSPTKTPPEKKTLPEVHTIIDVIGSALKFESESELYFPSASLDPTEKRRLFVWASDAGWGIIDHSQGGSEGGLTLTKNEVAEELLFRPEKPEPTM